MENPLRQIKHFTRRSPRLALTAALVVLLSGGTGVYAGLGGFTAPREEVNLDAGLVGWWKLNGNANDSSGNGNNGTVNGATLTSDRFGNANSAYNFDGTDDRIQTSVSSEVNDLYADSGRAWSTSAWFKNSSTASDQMIIGRGGGTGASATFGVYLNNGTLNTRLRGALTSLSPGLNDGNWHFVAITWDGSAATLYLDDQAGTTLNVGTAGLQNNNVTIGSTKDGTISWFNGDIDDVRLYSRGLDAAEVTYLRTGFGDSGAAKIGISDTQKGLVGHWKLDGDAKDSSAYRNHGTINGASATTDRHGKPDGAYSFDGIDDYIVSDPADQTMNNYTVSAWVKASATGQAVNKSVFNNFNNVGVGGTNDSFQFDVDGGSPGNYRLVMTGTTGDYVLFGTVTTAWQHLTATYDGTTIRTYLNGQLANSLDKSPSEAGTFFRHYVMGRNRNGNIYFNGSIDDVRVYNRALTSSDIKQLYDQYDANISVSSLQKQLVGHWSFDGDAKDRTPYRNHGTPVNGPVLAADRRGRANSAYSFDGADDYVEIPGIPQTAGQFTVSAWVKGISGPTAAGGYGYIVHRGVNNTIGSTIYWLGVRDNGNYSAAANGRYVEGDSGVVANATTWRLLTLTYDGITQRTYLDGLLKASFATSLTNNTSGNRLTVGSTAHSPTYRPFNGLIDDVRIYSRALSAAEVQALYDTY